ncbi:glycosyltransferase family 4 protein [Salinibacterium sp. dk2585]|uniref:glycosyltransferase n=1 Tax=unclassified Salinibacterium TaxID=2632331 RepID=UPI0011C253F4|nr:MULTISPECIES: glycosyltransferase [unclassified Salinibacterium]QEE60841.1 glycosyltransferase family 4 protein [Salinibacterium sp. dk2585]TXK55913.1 glycosyltransferase family 4 protein [Salinibacterium sp. dk5596]
MYTVTAYGRMAGSARVRVFDWLDWLGLEPRSMETYVSGSDNRLSSLVRKLPGVATAELRLRALPRRVADDTVLLSRQASPFSRGGIEDRILRAARHGVYDFDDALMLAPHSAATALWPKPLIWRKAVSAADTVVAGNEFLADSAAAFNPNVSVIPSCVDPASYPRKTNYDLSSTPRALWLGSPSTERYLDLISSALLRINSLTGLRLTMISAGAASLGSLDRIVDRVDWDPHFARHLAGADFGIMPLDDTDWERGKCAYKLLQYGAAGLPLVGSPVGANRPVLAGADGLAPETEDEWFDAMSALLRESSERREQRGMTAWAHISENYSFSAWQDKWLDTVKP